MGWSVLPRDVVPVWGGDECARAAFESSFVQIIGTVG